MVVAGVVVGVVVVLVGGVGALLGGVVGGELGAAAVAPPTGLERPTTSAAATFAGEGTAVVAP